ncbi:Ig-like domain-containing protein [uncultured Shewanella sp.]|uniref:Ig-like domain-containing protein n=1 Tax=Shewanella atlantica TaxID=271099 RepID=UPI002608AB94|nr:Ig-like domain-containing protein [uncultured Shewanella sp.]
MMNISDIRIPYKKLILASMISLLVACGSDNDDPVPPPEDNNPPIANPSDAETVIGSSILIDALANDTDPDGDPLTIETVSVTEGSGTASIQDNKILFEPVEVGTTIINYTISDGNGGEASSTVTVVVTASGAALTYVGTETCIACHTDKKSYYETGHNFKLTKIIDGKMPVYPFTSLDGSIELMDGVTNTLGKPESWADISYVIGGYKKVGMFIDANGYIINGTKVKPIVAPKGEKVTTMLPEYPYKDPDASPYGYCGRCHTTGWKDYTEGAGDNRNLNRQDDLPGMDGTFAMTGVQCESCHGAGSEHIKAPAKHNIVKIAEARVPGDYTAEDMGYGKAAACIECHTTDDAVRRYPDYESPFEQEFGAPSLGARLKREDHTFGPEGRKDGRGGRHAASTMIGVDPDTGVAMGKKKDFTCSTCHNPHQSEHYQDKPGHENAMVRECTDCHTKEFADLPGSDMASAAHKFIAECKDCHMPGSSHLLKIDLEGAKEDPRHFSADGKWQKPWLRAWDSCSGCHEEDYDLRATQIGKIHK